MFIKQLSLWQFRNYSKLDLSLLPGVNIFIGPNGAGKSNLLEAVSVLCAGQSHRGADAKHLIQWEKNELWLKGRFEGEETLALEARQTKGRPRQFLLNGHAQKRARDWVGKVPLVSFSPDDLYLVKGEPSLRRRALNAALAQGDPVYWEALQRYTKILEERNAALRLIREGGGGPAHLDPWDASFLKEGAFLSLARRAFIARFSSLVERCHGGLSARKEKASLEYKASFHIPAEDPEAVVAANRERLADLRDGEVALGSSLIGPHRDDLEMLIDGAPARFYGSQGQQRTMALAVKLAEKDYLVEKLRRQPLCLLDDMLSELDPARRRNLVELLANGSQCLVSLTHLEEWPGSPPREGLFHLAQGRLSHGQKS